MNELVNQSINQRRKNDEDDDNDADDDDHNNDDDDEVVGNCSKITAGSLQCNLFDNFSAHLVPARAPTRHLATSQLDVATVSADVSLCQ